VKYPVIAFALLITASVYSAQKPSPQDAFTKLVEGNSRYVKGKPEHPRQSSSVRKGLIQGQSPFAIIVSCSDSRVPPEIIFDQGLGDLFVVRSAGNVAGAIEKDSVEFAADKLHTPLIVVLGHQGCGAVNAVLNGLAKEYDLGHIAPLIEKSLLLAKGRQGDPLQNAIVENAEMVAETLASSPILKKLIEAGSLKIIPAYYSQTSGKVTFKTG
jgi:carbonic anhydrase